jgi:hypoxanthine phosphoribosyltransferase
MFEIVLAGAAVMVLLLAFLATELAGREKRRSSDVFLTSHEIAVGVSRVADEIMRTVPDEEELVLICVLKGSVVFFSDLMRKIPRKLKIDFIQCSSYGDEKESSGNVVFKQMWSEDLSGKFVIVVDDIYDTGSTMSAIRREILSQDPAKCPQMIYSCTLIRRIGDGGPTFSAFDVDKGDWIYGYGLDHEGQYFRNLNSIHRVDK